MAKAWEILSLGRTEAGRRAQQVRVEGVITFVVPDRPWFYVQDDTAGILVVQTELQTPVRVGQKVDVTGRTRDGSFAPFINAESLTLTGDAPLPPPRRASSVEVLRQMRFGQWVETTGVVRDAVYSPIDGRLSLLLTSRQGYCTAVIHGADSKSLAENLREAEVTVQGLAWSYGGGELHATGMDHVVIRPRTGPEGFDRPMLQAGKLATPVNDEPARLKAVFLFSDSIGRCYLLSEDGTPVLTVTLDLLKRSAASDPQLSQEMMVQPAPGDEVELLGMASPERGLAVVRECQFRVVGRGRPVPLPVRTTVAGAADPGAAGKLLAVEGLIVKRETRRMEVHGFFQKFVTLPVLTIEDGGHRLEVFAPPGSEKQCLALPADNLIEVTGYQLDQEGIPLQLWLRKPDDAVAKGRSRQAIMSIVWWGLGGVGALLFTGGGFILALRGKLKWQRSKAALLETRAAEIRELNASLEQRVSERTAELAEANKRLHRASAEAHASLDRERELGELKSNFVSMVSHEFRTPLSVILSSTELLSNHLDRLPPERRAQQLEFIRGSTRQMARLIEEVLLLGKVEAGRMTFEPVPLHPRGLCSALVDEALSATGRRCPIFLECAGDLPPSIMADPALLRHILTNLLSNAAKYSPEGESVSLTVGLEDHRIFLRVADHGIGIPPADLPHLFDPFHRAKNVGQISGTGLGLTITQRCVEIHGGTIEVQSPPAEGTTVLVRIPLVLPSSPNPPSS